MSTQILSIIAVAGAWIGGLGLVFANASFCFGFINPRLFRLGLIYLLVTDVGLIAMLASLLGIYNFDNVLWVFSAIGLIVLVGITVAAFIIIRRGDRVVPAANTAIETTRRRIEF